MKVINRIKKYQEFIEIINLKKFKQNDIYRIYFRVNETDHTRIGILVTKKNGIAVIRNKIKRQIRNILVNTIDFKNNLDLVIVVSKNYKVEDFKNNEEKLQCLLACILKEEK